MERDVLKRSVALWLLGLPSHFSHNAATCRGISFCPCYFSVDHAVGPDLCCACVAAPTRLAIPVASARQHGQACHLPTDPHPPPADHQPGDTDRAATAFFTHRDNQKGAQGPRRVLPADSGAVAIMPSGRLAARIGSGSARFLSCQLVGSLSMGGCRRRAVLPGLLRTGMATGVSSAGLRRLAGSGVQGLDDVGRIWPRWPGA
jgi:hypothetical protein